MFFCYVGCLISEFFVFKALVPSKVYLPFCMKEMLPVKNCFFLCPFHSGTETRKMIGFSYVSNHCLNVAAIVLDCTNQLLATEIFRLQVHFHSTQNLVSVKKAHYMFFFDTSFFFNPKIYKTSELKLKQKFSLCWM